MKNHYCSSGHNKFRYIFIITEVGEVETLVISPLSVEPDSRHRKNVSESCSCTSCYYGVSSVFLCGEPEIYHKFVFEPSFKFDIHHVSDSDAQWCMAKELLDGSLKNISGRIDIV